MHRGMKYAAMRAASNVLLRDVNTSLIIEEMYRGTNVIYADFTDYDELAHHCGPERVESLEALDGVDAAIGTLAKGRRGRARPYQFVVLSDHGQSLGATFKQRYGKSLGEVIRELMTAAPPSSSRRDRARARFRQLVPVGDHAQQGRSARAMPGRRSRARRVDGVVDLDAEEVPPPADGIDDRGRRLRQPRARLLHGPRPPADARGARGPAPGLVGALAAHPGVGAADGPVRRSRAVVFGPRASAISTRTVSKARTHDDSSDRTRSRACSARMRWPTRRTCCS